MALSESELSRYDRQLSLAEVGREGQEKLKAAKVVIVGAGGLGSSAGCYLAAAGVGELVVVDPDKVELSNLNRQILHSEGELRKGKADSAVRRLKALNSGVRLTGVAQRVVPANAARLLTGADAAVDALDNFESRFVINDACLELGVPLIHGACHGFEGRATTVLPGKTPCLRCFVSSSEAVCPAPQGERPPVLGATPGVIGAVQATEAIKRILGKGSLLAGKLLIYDGLQMDFRLSWIEKDPKCPACGGKA